MVDFLKKGNVRKEGTFRNGRKQCKTKDFTLMLITVYHVFNVPLSTGDCLLKSRARVFKKNLKLSIIPKIIHSWQRVPNLPIS